MSVDNIACSLAAKSSVAGLPVSLFWLLSTLKYTKLNGLASVVGHKTQRRQAHGRPTKATGPTKAIAHRINNFLIQVVCS
jgi:hypothetical protein